MLAARSPHSSAPAIIKLLLKNGANPSLPDFHSWTALLRASWNGREPNVSVLLTGVDGRVSNVNERDRGGWTAIMRAAWYAHLCSFNDFNN